MIDNLGHDSNGVVSDLHAWLLCYMFLIATIQYVECLFRVVEYVCRYLICLDSETFASACYATSLVRTVLTTFKAVLEWALLSYVSRRLARYNPDNPHPVHGES